MKLCIKKNNAKHLELNVQIDGIVNSEIMDVMIVEVNVVQHILK